MNITRLKADEVKALWPALLPHIERALEGGFDEMLSDDVLEQASEGLMQVWSVGTVAVCVTQVVEYPRKKVLVAAFCGGTEGPQWWTDLDLTLETFAADNGCQEVRWIGRDGWLRRLKGYEVMATIARKRIWAA